MKIAAKCFVAIVLVCSAVAFSQESIPSGDKAISVLELAPPSERVVLQDPVTPLPEQSTPAEVVLSEPSSGACCIPCCPDSCIPTTFCLVDPCGCPHEACVDVPACCVDQQPEVTWRGGVFGRQVAMLCWNCCDFEAKVIVARNGKVRVRD